MKLRFDTRSLFLFSFVATSAAAVACSSNQGQEDILDDGSGGENARASGGGTTTGGGFDPIIGSGGGSTDTVELCDELTDECHYVLVDPGPACGDGTVDTAEGEECDDGNTFPGDGCTGVCVIEPYSECPTDGGPCVSTIICGDGERGPGESCDDGNTDADDGCSATCRTESGYYCPTPGDDCVELVSCGDGLKQPGEACDDGANVDGDGCDADCAVEEGWRCIYYPDAGLTCEELPVCGDGVLEGTETCDDNNQRNGDGCSSLCRVEASYWDCSDVGSDCDLDIECGDGKVEANEQCDDGNRLSGDGCSSSCKLSSGWLCPVPGEKCVPDCGDGQVTSAESCDDSNKVSGDGCSSTCQLEPGFVCVVSGASGGACHATECGDGIVEGGEACDEGDDNGLFYGWDGDSGDPRGCSLACTQEPNCRNSSGVNRACDITCGDGVKEGSEACDDGNLFNGDGCSSSCTEEEGYTCDDVTVSDAVPCPSNSSADCLVLPITYRDFKSMKFNGDGYGHPDFFHAGYGGIPTGDQPTPNSVRTGIANSTLGADGVPTLLNGSPTGFQDVTSASTFAQWFQASAYSKETVGELALQDQNNGSFQFSATGANGFFPLDNIMKWTSEDKICADWDKYKWDQCSSATGAFHNYHFTSEVRYLFPYRGGEVLTFSGDDDVWVYINGRLAIDLGGTHQDNRRTATLSGSGATITGADPWGNTITPYSVELALTTGRVFEIVVFHADRHPVDLNYTLTLSGFDVTRSNCYPTCGDGVATVTEECDEGTAKNDGSYGGCNPNCTFADRCGDAEIQSSYGEVCDDGVNQSTIYDAPPPACGPGCTAPPTCGDGIIHSIYGESCDDGDDNSDSTYGACSTTCSLGAFCGDGITQSLAGEECDDGVNLGGYGQCDVGCVLGERCGDGEVQAGEQCDDADPATPDCVGCGLAAICGDGIVQTGEDCDDGINDGSYGGCAVDCLYGPRCGDGVTQSEHGEACDLGDAVNSDTLYGGCTTTCGLGPHCGDGVRQSGTSEQCDDGNNESGDGCSGDCRTEVLVVK